MATVIKPQTLQVNHEYTCVRHSETTFIIFYKEESGPRPFYGISNEGDILEFDERGLDQFFEMGGHWWKLDLKSARPVEPIFNWKRK